MHSVTACIIFSPCYLLDPSSMNYDLLAMFDLPKHSSLERTFGNLISKLDDMLDSRTSVPKRQETLQVVAVNFD